jgi:outer membrane receptor protein involved in Fe transport
MKRLILAIALAGGTAAAQPGSQISDVEVPVVVIEQGDQTTGPAGDEALDLANIVQSAAKGVTTVQEAPAIVTVVTADEIRERQFADLTELADNVPGWMSVGLYHSTFPTPLVRGQVQAVQFLHDGMSLFDPFVNVPSISRVQPMELIKRVEMITGPGGVLWGSNSLVGIMNVITKDAEDVEGVEVGGSLGNGSGDRKMGRAYVMAGRSDLMRGKLKVFVHGSAETYQGPDFKNPQLIFHDALPQPNSANIYGPLIETEEAQSLLVNLNAKITYDKLQLRVSSPFSKKYNPFGLSGQPVRTDLPEDSHCMNNGEVDPMCVDNLRKSRENREDVFDRYAVAEYRTRFAKDSAGITLRAYGIQFVRNFAPLQVLAASGLVPGGLSFDTDLTSYRGGGAFDGDVEIAKQFRVQYGAEAFHEWKPENVTTSRQGPGTQTDLDAPYDLARLPLPCPREFDPAQMKLVPVPGCPITFAFPADRTVFGGYINPQFRPSKKLIFDAGIRLQIAPEELGSLSYPLTQTIGGAVVWNFIPNWHLKLNYTQGFRPPVFNNTVSNGEDLQINGNPKLNVETSDAAQAEINARIFKGERRIRELAFRIDASYTRITNLIQVAGGQYFNSGERDLASVEFLGKLYIQGGHRIELGYTYLRGDTSDKGLLKSLPEHWFNLATVFQLVSNKLVATTNLKVVGAAEDPNRLVEYRGLMADPTTGVITNPQIVLPTDLVMDRIPPIAELSAGVTWMPVPKLAIRAQVYDALAGHYYQPDAFFDYEPHLEYLPNPFEGFRAYVSALYQY